MKKIIILFFIAIIACQKPVQNNLHVRSIDLSKSLNLKFGNESLDVEDLNRYLKNYGYLSKPIYDQMAIKAQFTLDTEIALKHFQSKFGLEPTGIVDKLTYELINTPRCGISDTENYVLQGSRWNLTTLKYEFSNFSSDLEENEIKTALIEAFGLWSNSTNLKIEEVSPNQQPEIIIQFGSGEHSDGNPFDRTGNVLAHAYYPSPSSGQFAGDAHFDDAELWTVNLPVPNAGIDLVTVAAHEIGHSLGLGHSNVSSALMFPFYSGDNRNLDQDDIDGIHALYHPSLGREWERLPGSAIDIAVHSEKSIYIIGTDRKIYKWDKNTWTALPGSGHRISVSSDNKPWIVGTDRGIYKWETDNWVQVPGSAIDIAVGEKNNIWVIGTDLRIYKWNGENWESKPGAGIRITVGKEGIPSIVGTDNKIYVWKNDNWVQKPGEAYDIAIGNNTIWMVGTDYGIYRESNSRWIRTDGGASSIDVNENGTPWIVGTDLRIYRRK